MKFNVRWICKSGGGLALGFNYHFPYRVIYGDYKAGMTYKYWLLMINLLVLQISINNSREETK
jgi:hypothetical protein